MVAQRPRAGGRGGFDGASKQAPVKDADHVLGPLARREAVPLLEAHEPVVGVPFPDDEERASVLADGELSVYLWVCWKVMLQL